MGASHVNATLVKRLMVNRTRIRWLHIPKCGKSLSVSVNYYACDEQVHGLVTKQVLDHVGLYGPIGSRLDESGCPRSLGFSGHVPLAPSDIGHVIAMFRHPRSRIASFCRSRATKENPTAHPEKTHEYHRCIAAMVEGHMGVMTRMISGHSCGGAVFCNSMKQLGIVKPSDGMLIPAVRAVGGRVFLFVGVTEEWEPSIKLLHALIFPTTLPVLKEETLNIHPSTSTLNVDISSVWALEAAQTLKAQELTFFNMSGSHRALLSRDPDLLVFARARRRFCFDFHQHVDSKLPSACTSGLGPMALGPTNDEQLLLARTAKAAQLAKAEELLSTWQVDDPEFGLSAASIAGGFALDNTPL